MADTDTTELPPGYRLLNDGPGREVLVREEWEECPVFRTTAEAREWAWRQHREYQDDTSAASATPCGASTAAIQHL
jgi:hypothetical protein